MGYNHDRIKANARLFYKNNMGSSIITQLIYFGGLSVLLFRTGFCLP